MTPRTGDFEVEAILFDIDGTLVDSTAVVERATQTWARRRGIDQEKLAHCHGWRTEDLVAHVVPVAERAAAMAELEDLELADLNVRPVPGAATLLGGLPADRWAAVTSGTGVLMRARLAAAGLPIPEILIAAEDVRAGKPDPEGYLKAAAALGHDIARCLVVEDAPAGVHAGIAAGARVLAVATSHPAPDLIMADAVVPDLSACALRITGNGLILLAKQAGSFRRGAR